MPRVSSSFEVIVVGKSRHIEAKWFNWCPTRHRFYPDDRHLAGSATSLAVEGRATPYADLNTAVCGCTVCSALVITSEIPRS